ncbi:MAG: hypothetical protein HUU46_15860 [Candidatus Hydrogenedentes bacterium]|nr:hypothetical protein [Candidatus Hydrogenedentota bacterium]
MKSAPFTWLVLAVWSSALGAWGDVSFYPANIPAAEKGEFIFFNSGLIDPPASEEASKDRNAGVAYLKRFRICLTNGYKNFEGTNLDELHQAGCEFFIYRWFNGYYEKELVREGSADQDPYYRLFPKMIGLLREIHGRPEWLVNPATPMQGAGAVHPAYFFDYAEPEFRRFFVASIKSDLEESRYDGVFFDYIGSWALPDEVKKRWTDKHPDKTYDDCGVLFLRELRMAIGAKKIFGNQAYRLPEAYYDWIDYDVSESNATSFMWGTEARLHLQNAGDELVRDTFYRPWDGLNGYKRTSASRRERAVKYPHVKICDINYLQPRRVPTGKSIDVGGQPRPFFGERPDRPAIFYSYVAAKLDNAAAFASDWYAPGTAEDDVYFLDLGRPVQASFVETPAAVVRYYDNGFVLLTRSNGPLIFQPDPSMIPAGTTGVWDVFEGIPVRTWPTKQQVVIEPVWYPSTQSYYPSGRVFMYLREIQGRITN